MQTLPNRLRRVLSILTAFGLLLLVPACDSGNGDDDDGSGSGGGSINGMWAVSGPDEYFIQITNETVTFFDFLGDTVDAGDDCYEVDTLDIISRDGNVLNLGDADMPTFTLPFTATRSGDNLTIGYAGFGLTLTQSSRTAASMTPLCPGFGGKTDRLPKLLSAR